MSSGVIPYMATIKDVAKRAGVSTTTVSHVINKTRFVAEETKAAVWAAIKELHYCRAPWRAA